MKFEKIAKAITEENAHYKQTAARFIEESDGTMQRYATATRWKQYTAGKISREQCAEYAIERSNKQHDKSEAAALAKCEAIAAAADIKEITINIVWKRSSTWGYNPTATVTAYTDHTATTTTGRASGCGYDKRSAATAQAFNAQPALLKLIYILREQDQKPYGSGAHSAAPYYEGGVGIECYHKILALAGFEKVSDHGTKTTDYYHYVRQ